MASLFEISNELQEVINVISENGGEVTPEMEETLAVNEENLKEKLSEYSNLISQLKYDIDSCSSEIKRITELKKQKQKLHDKLTELTIGAIEQFGSESYGSKSKYIDLGTKKLSIRNNQSCDVDTEYLKFVGDKFKSFINGYKSNKLIGYEFVDDFIEEMEDGVTQSDLENTMVNIVVSIPMIDIAKGENENLNELIKNFDCDLVCEASKTECKNILNRGIELSYATLNPTKSLILK